MKTVKKRFTRNDPIKKILSTNQRVVKYKNFENQKLLRILERIELDKPILMHDKLDIIWDKDEEWENKQAQRKKSNSPDLDKATAKSKSPSKSPKRK